MINCLLIKITQNSRGLPMRSYRTLVAEEIAFGRGAECTIHLPDPRIAMHHAVIKRRDDGELHLIALNGELEVDSASRQNIPLTQGMQIMVGPYLLTVEPTPPDIDLSISLALAHSLPDDFQNIKSRTHEPLPGATRFKRRLSIWMAVLIALLFLALPLAQNLIPKLHDTMAELPFGFDRVWSPGHISNAHRHFGSQCANCHQTLTQQVTDQACMQCHRDTTPHITDPVLQHHAFEAKRKFLGSTRCGECHREHKAPQPLTRQDDGMCIKCHGNIKAINATTKLSDIHDFDKDHPGFKLTFKTGSSHDNNEKIERIPQTEKERLIENSGLNFPHSQHIGKVQGPNGMWDVRELSCKTCHQSKGKELQFEPIAYKRDCAACHAGELKVGSADSKFDVPHGSEQIVMNTLKLFAPKNVERYSEKLKTDGCAYCHVVETSNKGDALPWRVKPLQINQDWFSKARFKHASHRTQQCDSCHQVESSETSADVAMPDRDSCLRCHSGKRPKHKRIASGCMSCHDFHSVHATVNAPISSESSTQDTLDKALSISEQSPKEKE
ncbi:MAG: cytochrome c3 family protein [Methylotenera sp.]|nr:cytochrome c3 family protein [Methylotenera sp.]MDO9232982.1 cytochrome c3 family protein [Methylotenera sp.]MDO9388957.1 cytochrome c3 family protein [Methylotenera sp.]MDP2102614.1 cytochrome c3 family protein [Methylotenera sp.]MDP2280140.1 cytochrome c3 family protein [Methylotenera sp.]